jgi:hypothetical protein
VRIRTYNGSTVMVEFVCQLFFDDATTDQVFTQAPYNQRGPRDTRNARNMVLTGTRTGSVLYLNLAKDGSGYTGNVDIGVNLKTAAAGKPAIRSGGVVNAFGFQAGTAPGAWISIFGQNLAAAAHSLSSSEMQNGNFPTTLSGVTVRIDNQPAFLSYVSPTQINAQAPADSALGSVAVTVTNSAGTSDALTTTLQPVLPAFYAVEKYVGAVRCSPVRSSRFMAPASVLLIPRSRLEPWCRRLSRLPTM